MRKKITFGIILLVVLIIINSVIGGVLILFIQDIHEPKIDVELNLSQITSNQLNFTARISMVNDNQFDLVARNLSIIGKTPRGDTILDIQIGGGTIAAKQQKIFTATESLMFSGELSSTIYSSIQGIFGVNFAGIFEKTIPVHINITASFQDLFNNISSPTLSLLAEVTEITEEGVLFHALVSVDNPNHFEMALENFTIRIETEQGNLVGEFSQLQGVISPTGTSQFHLNGTLLYDALDAKILTLRIAGDAGIHLMGIDKSITLSSIAHLTVPDIKQLLFHNQPLGITLSLDVKLRLRGFLTTIGLTLSNPTKIPLRANELLCSIYGLTGENKKMIAQKTMEPTTLEPTQQNYLETQLLIPYIKIFTSGTKKIFPDWFVIQLEGNVTLAGVTQSIPVTIDATINPHLLQP
jgi:LEA14-like dessication related protein